MLPAQRVPQILRRTTTRRFINLDAIGHRLALLLIASLLISGTALAQQMVTEVVPAGFRSAEELAAILKPLIPMPGSVAAFHNQLVIKTTPANLAELRQLLAKLDKAPANLMVSVRRTLDAEVSRDLAQASLALRGAAGSARVGGVSGDNQRNIRAHSGAAVAVHRGAPSAQGQVQQRTVTNQDSSTQRVRVLEGKEAFIQTGESIAVGDRQVVITGSGVVVNEGTRQEEFGSGFWARVRLNGDQVTVDIYPDQRRRRADGNAAVQRTSTSVSGVVGRWIEIGSVNVQASRDSSAIGSSRSLTTRQQQSTYVKVELLD